MNKGAAPVTLYPYALISRHGTPQARGLLHPARGPDRRVRRQGPAGGQLRRHREGEDASRSRPPTPGSASPTSIGRRRCSPTPAPSVKAQFSAGQVGTTKTYQTDYLLDPLTIAPGAHRRRQRAAVRRRQGGRDRRRLRRGAQAQPLRAADRLGLFLLHHQAAVPGDGLDLPLVRQFRRRHPAHHRASSRSSSSRSPTSPTPRWRR